MTTTKFEELTVTANIKRAVAEMGFIDATPIQAQAIPALRAGRDIIGQARTGTGKTAAFAIPVIEKIDPANKSLQALIMCPTRELAIQVTEEFRKLYKYYFNISATAVYGGQEIGRQLAALAKKPQIIVGTPGRLMDHMRRRTIRIDTVKIVVLDEADEMLNMGFRDDMEFILGQIPQPRQTVMFSATMNRDIMGLMGRYQNNPAVINVAGDKAARPKIEQHYFDMQEMDKPEALTNLIDHHEIKTALVFSNTKARVERIVKRLKTAGYPADALHGGLDQRRRERAMNSFKNGNIGILVATDVAGRGIDVCDIEAVFNYDLPMDDEDYIHRIGRTARAGKSGKAFTFVVGPQLHNLMRIQRAEGLKIQCGKIPALRNQ
jgi:ATP-dependent RNA helicase DeaD